MCAALRSRAKLNEGIIGLVIEVIEIDELSD